MEAKVLVVGAVLLDMIGEYPGEQAELQNKTGTVRLSLGGAAFNVAANLAEKGFKTSLFTCFRKGSSTTQLIRTGLAQSGIDIRHAVEVTVNAEPAYVALLVDKRLTYGVTSSPIERIDILETGELEKAVKECSFIAIDTNLTTSQIQSVVDLASKYHKPIAAGIVSDAKVTRISSVPESNFHKRFEFVCLNAVEAQSLGFPIDVIASPQRSVEVAAAMCTSLNAEAVIVSNAQNGHYVLRRNGSVKKFDAPNVHVANTLGAGDALFSASCAAWIKHQNVDSDAANLIVSDWVSSVLSTTRANINSARFDKVAATSETWPFFALAFTIVSVLLMAVGTFAHDITPLQFALCLFGCCLTAGPAAALVRRFLRSDPTHREGTDAQLIAVGALAGIIAGLLASLPHLSVAVVKHNLSKDIDDLRLVPILAFLLSVAAGIAFELFLSNIKRNVEQLGE
jgi:sugar/nucleoside kinase (ribokinase family)